MKFRATAMGTMAFALAGMVSFQRSAHADKDVDYKSMSLGVRAANYKPKDGDSSWYGGAQLRFYPGKAFGIEGSADYRKTDVGDTTLKVVPLQASLLAYLIPNKVVDPFL